MIQTAPLTTAASGEAEPITTATDGAIPPKATAAIAMPFSQAAVS